MDTIQLERLSALTRAMVAGTASPLLRLFYWREFLDRYLQSGIRSPVYLEDAVPAMTALLDRAQGDLVDLEFVARLRELAASGRLPESAVVRDFRRAVAALPMPRPPDPPSEASAELHASVLLVPAGLPLLGRRPELAVPALLSIRASRGLRAPGEIQWRIQTEDGDPILLAARSALAAAVRAINGGKRARLSYEIRLLRSDWQLRGTSLGLALAVIFWSFETAERRRRPVAGVPARDVAILGGVDESGWTIPVAADTFPWKVRAAFGAGYRAIVVPRGAMAEAQSELDRLHGLFPDRPTPALVPVETLHDVVGRQELFARPVQPVRSLIARSKTSRITALVLLILIALGAVFWFRPRTWLPENTHLVQFKQLSRSVTVRLSGVPARQRHWTLDTDVNQAAIVDLRPRAKAALVVGTALNGPHPARVYCFDLNSGDTLWTRDLTSPLWLTESEGAKLGMIVTEIAGADFDSDGRGDVAAVVIGSPMSPCFVYWLRDDGTTRSVYAHRGYLFHPNVVDIEGDGKLELFLVGTSNTDEKWSQSGTLVVLDRDHFSGWPDGGAFHGSSRAPCDSALARVVFPPIPAYCEIFGIPGFDVRSYQVFASETNPLVTLTVGSVNDPGIVVTLDRDYAPVRVVAEDNLRPSVFAALESGRIKEDFTGEGAMAEYKARIRRVR